MAQLTPSACVGTTSFAWTFGDGTSSNPAPASTSHTWVTAGDFAWSVTATVDGQALTPVSGTVRVTNEVCASRPVVAKPPVRAGAAYVEALWQDSGVTVHAGETLTVTATGTWSVGGASLTAAGNAAQSLVGPNGPLPGAPMGALVGRIGTGAAFVVQSGQAIPVNAVGTLWLTINDHWYALGDNSGALSVSICVGS